MQARSVFVNLQKYGITPASFEESTDEQVVDGMVSITDELYVQVAVFEPKMFLCRWITTEQKTKAVKTIASTRTIATLARHIKKELSHV